MAALSLLASASLPASARGVSADEVTSLAWATSGPRTMVVAPGATGQITTDSVFQPAVFRGVNDSYLMEYTGYASGLDVVLGAHSPEGITWTKDTSYLYGWNGIASPFVMAVAGGYRMWATAIFWGGGPLGYVDRIYAWNSTDGITWATSPWMVLDVGNGSAWDGAALGDPMVTAAPGGGYLMYYSGTAANGTAAIGVATSTDLVTFKKWSGNPVLRASSAGGWDNYGVSSPSAVPGSPWAMFYVGRGPSTHTQIGLATSDDGYHWARGSVPFLAFDVLGSWDSGSLGGPDYAGGAAPRLFYDGGSNQSARSNIGFVNLSLPGGTPGTPTGFSALEIAGLAIAVVGVAGVLAAVFIHRSRRPGPP